MKKYKFKPLVEKLLSLLKDEEYHLRNGQYKYVTGMTPYKNELTSHFETYLANHQLAGTHIDASTIEKIITQAKINANLLEATKLGVTQAQQKLQTVFEKSNSFNVYTKTHARKITDAQPAKQDLQF